MTVAAPPTEKQSARTALGNQAGRAAFWNTVLLPAKLLSHFAATVILARTVPSAAFGVYVIALAISSTSGALVDLGTERSVVKFLPEVAGREGRRGVSRLIRWVFGFKMAVLVPVLLATLVLHDYFFRYLDSRVDPAKQDVASFVREQHWTIYGVIVAFVLIGAFYDVAMQSMIATFRNRSWNLVTIAVSLIEPLVVAVIALRGGNIVTILLGRVVVDLIALLIAGTVATVAVFRAPTEETVHIAEEDRNVPMPVRRFTRYSILQYALQVTSFITSYAFASIILPSTDQAAGYRIAAGIVTSVLSALVVPITGLQVPVFTRIFTRRDDESLGTVYALLARFLALVLIPSAVGLALLIPNLFRIVYPNYIGFAAVSMVICVLSFTESCLSTGTTILLTYERYKWVIFSRGLALLAIPLMFVTVPRFGALGAAFTSGGCAVLAQLTGTIAANTLLPIRYPLRFLGRVLPAVVVMGVVVGGLANTIGRVPLDAGGGLQRIVWFAVTGATAAAGAAAYIVVFRLLGGMDTDDVERLATLNIPFKRVALRLLAGGRAA